MKRYAPRCRPAYATGVLALAVAAALAGCSKRHEAARSRSAPPLVTAAAPVWHRFVEQVDAVGTARANEQVALASPVTERIDRLYFDDGDFIRKDQIVARLAQGQEQASLAAANAQEQQAQAQLRRITALNDRGFATVATLDQQVSLARRARAEADDARAQIADRVIRAPFAGQVSLRTISAGTIASAGTVIATISDLSRIKLDFAVPETVLAGIRPGQEIHAIAAAYPDAPFPGRVATIDPVIDPSTRAAVVRAVLPNPGNRLKPGMLLTVRIITASHVALAVPELAVIGDSGDRFVFIVDERGKAVRLRVVTGLRDQGLVEVTGLPFGARVIGEGVVKIANGSAVRVQEDHIANKHGGGAPS